MRPSDKRPILSLDIKSISSERKHVSLESGVGIAAPKQWQPTMSRCSFSIQARSERIVLLGQYISSHRFGSQKLSQGFQK